MKYLSGSIVATFAGACALAAGLISPAQTTTTQVMTLRSQAPGAAKPGGAAPPVQIAPGGIRYTKVGSPGGAKSQTAQNVKVNVVHAPAVTASATSKTTGAKAEFRPKPHFAPAPTVVTSLNFGNATVGSAPVTMTLNYPADATSPGASSVVPNGGTAPGAATDYIFFGNSNVEFGQQGGGQPSNLTNFTVSTLNNVEYPGNGNYTKITAPGGTTPFTTGTVVENPTSYPSTTPHTTLLATFSPFSSGSFTVYILDGNTDGVYVGNSSVGLGVNGGPAVVTASRYLQGTNEFTRYNVANASPSDVFQVYATTNTNSYPSIGGLTFVMGTSNSGLTAATTVNQEFQVSSTNCTGSTCSVQVTFTPAYPGLRYDALTLTDNAGNMVYQTYLYGVGQAPQTAYEIGNLTEYDGFLTNPMGIAIGPDEYLYYTTTGSNTITQFARDFSTTNTFQINGLDSPSGIAVDGSNTVYVADQVNNVIFSYTEAGVQGTVTTDQLNGPSQIAVDGTGALYIADTGNGRIIKIDNQGNETTLASGLTSPTAVTVDSAGDVFYADSGNGGEIFELAAGATTATTYTSQIGAVPYILATDAGGTIYLTTSQGLNLFFGGNNVGSYYADGEYVSYGLAIDRNGDILQANPYDNANFFSILDRSSSNFILNTPPGMTTNGTITIGNSGNQPLTFSSFTTTGPEFTIGPASNVSTPCQTVGMLQPGAMCEVYILFTPPLASYYQDTMIATDNSLNMAGTTNPFYLAGSGTGAASTTTVSAAPSEAQSGTPVELLVTVSDSPMTFTPTGPVTFMDGSTVLGTAMLIPGTLPDTATASYTTSTLSLGTHSITAVFPGDVNVSNSTSSAITVTVGTTNYLPSGLPPTDPFGQPSVTAQNLGSVAVGSSQYVVLSRPFQGGGESVTSTSTEFTVSGTQCGTGGCSIGITFAPASPGLRTGVILLRDGNGNIDDEYYLTGTGTGPLFGFDPGTDSLYSGTVGAPGAVAFSQDRSLYLADDSTNQVFIAVNGVFQNASNPSPITALPIVNLGTIGGVAVDGADEVYVSDQTHNLIVTYNPNLPSSDAQGSIPTSPLSSPAGVAVDGAGNLYIADTGHSRIIKIDNLGNETTVTSNAAHVGPMAVDSGGDLYYAITASPGSIMYVPAGGGTPTSYASGISNIHGLAVDAANRVYYTNDAGLSIVPLPSCSGCPIEGVPLPGFPAQALTGVVLDGSGDIFATQPSTGLFALSVRSAGNNAVQGPVGMTTAGSPFVVSNTGNTPLTISAIAFQNATIFSAASNSTCTGSMVLQPGSICDIVPNFTPAQAQQYTDPVTFTSNSLNSVGPSGTFTLYGTGTPAGGSGGTTTLALSPTGSISLGQTLTLSATVTGVTSSAPTGTVNFVSNGVTIASGTLVRNGTTATASAVVNDSSLAVGTFSITAMYAGDSNNPSSSSGAQTINVLPGTPSVSIAGQSSITVGQNETLTATIGSLASTAPTGSVEFFDGGSQLGNAPVTQTSTGGTATFTAIGLSVGTHLISAQYGGDSNYTQANSSLLTVTVSASIDSVNFGSVAVGSSSNTMTLTFPSAGGNSSFAVVNSAEFVVNETCNSTCTATVAFHPQSPGLRYGAISLLDANGNLVAKTFLYGTGQAPQFAFDPPYNQSTVSPYSAQSPVDIAVGPDGTVYVSDSGTNTVTGYPIDGNSFTVPLGNIGQVGSIAVDGSNTVYVSDDENGQIVASTASGVVSTMPSGNANGLGRNATLAVDGTGALYILAAGPEAIFKYDNQGNFTTLPVSLTDSAGMTVDAAGDVFYTDSNGQQGFIYELPASGGSPITVASGLSSRIYTLALDAAGRLYYLTYDTDSTLNGLSPGTTAPGSSFTVTIPHSSGGFTGGLAITATGGILATEAVSGSADVVALFDRKEASYTTSAQVGATSQFTFPISNTGDTPLTVSNLSINGAAFTIDSASTCAAGSILQPAAVCLVTLDFSPTVIQNFTGVLTVSANTLNSGTTQSYQFTAYGQGLAGSGATSSATTFVASSSSAMVGQTIGVVATVTDTAGVTPTGTVNFLYGTTVLASATLVAGSAPGTATASATIPSMAAGTYSVTAMYAGGSAVAASTSAAQNLTFTPATTTTIVTPSALNITVGQNETLTATISGFASPAMTGTVSFFDGTTPIGSGTVTSTSTGGTATLALGTTVPVGTHQFIATYNADANYAVSTSQPITVIVSPASAAATRVSFSTSAGNPTAYERPFALVATVTTTTGGAPVTAGQVIFCESSQAQPRCNLLSNLGVAQLNSGGVATLRIYAGQIGVHTYVAQFLGTTAFASAQSSSQDVIVSGIYPSVTSLASSGVPGNYNLTATVTGYGSIGYLTTGSVSFVDTSNGNASLGSASLTYFTPGFSAAQPTGSPISVGTNPYGVAAGDLNGDGFVDVVVENYLSNTVSVLLGNGNGTFLPQVTYAVGNRPERVLMADFNGDGYMDLVVANTGSSTVSVLLNKGDGTFYPQVTYPVGSPVGLGVMDLNHDGIADIVAADYYNNSVSVLLGNSDGTFKPAVTYPAGNTPQTLAEGDFNNDGNIDLAVGNVGDGTVSVFLGNGDGTFQAQVTHFVGSGGPGGLQVGDLNSDGNADIAVANSSLGNVGVLLGNGDGTFQPQVTYAVGTDPIGLVIADFDGDGKLDLSVGNGGQNSLYQSILLGNGDGTFQPQLTFPTGNFPYGTAVGDFNGDGYPDMAISNWNDGTATILLSQITQSAVASISGVAVTGAPATHAVDAVYAGNANYSTSTSTTVPLITAVMSQTITFPPIPNHMFGDAPFTLSATASSGLPVAYTVTLGPATVSGSTVTIAGVGTVTIQATQAGNSTYAAATPVSQSFTVAQASQTIAFASIPNQVTTAAPFSLNATASSGLTVSYTVTSGPATVSGSTVTLAGSAGTVVIQATQGGNTNYAAATPVSQSFTVSVATGAATTITLTTNAGTGVAYETPVKLTASVTTATSAPVTAGQVIFCSATAAHCNLNSNLGIAQLNSSGVAVLSVGSGTIGPHGFTAEFPGTTGFQASTSMPQLVTVTGLYPSTTTISSTGSAGNYNLTGTVVGIGSTTLSPTGSVSFLDTTNGISSLGSASLTYFTPGFGEAQPTGSPITVGNNPYGVAAADLNGDGFIDIATGNYDGTVSVALGLGDGTFLPAATYAVGGDPDQVLIADFNGDGYPDLVVANTASNTVSVLLNRGDGTFQTQVTYPVSSPGGLGVMDVNHDGIADIVATDYYSSQVSVLLGNGDGTFKAAVTYGAGNGPLTLAEGDFNGDGNIDLVVGNLADNTVGVYLGNGDGTFQAAVTYPVPAGSNPQGVQVGDFNGDGIADLAVSSSVGVSVLLGKGDGTFLPQVTYPAGSGPVGLAIADFNGDGYQDIAVDNSSSNSQSILLGNGDGTFQPQITFQTGNFPTGVAVGDFNGDGYPDMAISNFGDVTATILLSQITQSSVASISGVAVTGAAGTHTVDAVYAGDSNFKTSTSPAISLTSLGSGPAAQTITFPSIPNQTFGNAPFTLNATASSGLPVSYAVTSGPAAVSGSIVTLTGAGTVVIQATQTGNSSYAAATPVSRSFTVAQASQTITFPSIPNHVVTDAPFALSATASSGLPVGYSVTSGPATVSGSTVTLTGTGTVVLQASQAGNSTYAAATPVSQSFTVSTAVQTITFPAIPNHTFGDAPFTLSATASSNLAVSYNVTSGPATVAGNTVTLTGAGTVTIQASQAGNATYAAATPVSQSFTVSQESQTITFPAIPNHTVTDAPFALNATASSGLAVSYAVVSGPATISGSTVTLTGAGTVVIKASQSGNTNFAAATAVNQSFTVSLASQTITFPAIPNHTVTDAPFTVTATASSGLAVTLAVMSGPATISGNTVTLTGAGSVVIQATQAGNANYAAAPPVSQSFTISLATQTITFPAIPGHVFGDAPFTLSATASSGLPVTYSVTSGPATVLSNTVTLTGAGTVVIQATQVGNSTYAAATPVSQSFVVLPGIPTLVSITPASGTLNAGATTITLTGSNFASTDIVELNGAALTSTYVNAITLTAIIPASFFTSAGIGQVTVVDANGRTTASQTFTVVMAPSINFSGPTTTTSASQPTLTFQLVNPYPQTISGTLTLTFTASGTNGVDDPAVQFSNGGRTMTFTIPALSTVTPTVQIQTGTVAGTATISLVVTSNGVNVTPANVTPVQITIAAAPPTITTSAITRYSGILNVSVNGFSNTRELSMAIFHFTAVPGSTISTPDITAPVGTVFGNYFSSSASTGYGSTFVYTQTFNLNNNDATSIQSVTVTLVNSQGTSMTSTAQ
jgi:sugar lactone lactonase YvrE